MNRLFEEKEDYFLENSGRGKFVRVYPSSNIFEFHFVKILLWIIFHYWKISLSIFGYSLPWKKCFRL